MCVGEGRGGALVLWRSSSPPLTDQAQRNPQRVSSPGDGLPRPRTTSEQTFGFGGNVSLIAPQSSSLIYDLPYNRNSLAETVCPLF